MKLVFDEQAWEDYSHWQDNDRALLARVNRLIQESTRAPFAGTGKPEPLRGRSPAGGPAASPRNTGLCIARKATHY